MTVEVERDRDVVFEHDGVAAMYSDFDTKTTDLGVRYLEPVGRRYNGGRVLFIQPAIGGPAGINDGIPSMSGVLRYRGHGTGLIHMSEKMGFVPSDEEVAAMAREFNPDVIGYSALTMEYEDARRIARRLQADGQLSRKLHVIGGVHSSMVPVEVLRDNDFDVVMPGEADKNFPDLVDAYLDRQDISGLNAVYIHRDRFGRIALLTGQDLEGRVEESSGHIKNSLGVFPGLAGVPWRDYELFDVRRFLEVKKGFFGMLTGRGCPMKCTYCFNGDFVKGYQERGDKKSDGRHLATVKDFMRNYDADRVVDEVERLRRRFGDKIQTLIFDDDIFAFAPGRVQEFTEVYTRREVRLPYIGNAHPETVDDPRIMDYLKASGCRILKFGVESGSESMRRLIKRPAKEEAIVGAFEKAHSRDIHTSAFLMFGLPYETNEQINDTIDLTARINPGRFRWAIFFPFPGTAAYRLANGELDERDFANARALGFGAERGVSIIDKERMRGMHDYFGGSCLKFSEEQLLRIEKLARMFHWEVNARMPWGSAGEYREMVNWVNGMSRKEWEEEKAGIKALDRETAKRMSSEGKRRYELQFMDVMGVDSAWFDKRSEGWTSERDLGRLGPYDLE